MPFKVVRNDITKMQVDAIVNSANPQPLIGAGTDAAIYEAAGTQELLEERKKIGNIARGEAAITPAFHLNARCIIHTVGPKWQDGNSGEAALLRSCYEKSLRLAAAHKCQSIAFPLISTGIYGFPKEEALRIVLQTVKDFLLEQDMLIYLVVFDRVSSRLSEELTDRVESYIDDAYAETAYHGRSYAREREERLECAEPEIGALPSEMDAFLDECSDALPKASSAPPKAFSKRSLEKLLAQSGETFQQMLLRLITEKGLTNTEAYTRANQDKKLFSKIKKNVHYQPKKKTAMAFALALELNLDQAKDLLARAGYAFSPSSPLDLAVQYFIETQEYNIYEVEIILYDLGLETLCSY